MLQTKGTDYVIPQQTRSLFRNLLYIGTPFLSRHERKIFMDNNEFSFDSLLNCDEFSRYKNPKAVLCHRRFFESRQKICKRRKGCRKNQ